MVHARQIVVAWEEGFVQLWATTTCYEITPFGIALIAPDHVRLSAIRRRVSIELKTADERQLSRRGGER